MNYYNTNYLDLDYWLVKNKVKLQDILTSSSDSEESSSLLDERTQDSDSEDFNTIYKKFGGVRILDGSANPSNPPPIDSGQNVPWVYFITLTFPNIEYMIRHKEFKNGMVKDVLSKIKFRDCTQEEQVSFIRHTLTRYINLVCEKYDIFFEQHQSGDIHLHGRIFMNPKETMKNIRALFHRFFSVDSKYHRFIDIKEYNKDKWNDYQEKYKKTYQKTQFINFKNI